MDTGIDSANRERIAAITGASRGIGLAIAKALEPSFDRLVLIASSEKSFDGVRGDFTDRAAFYWADFSSSTDLRRLAEELRGQYSHIDALVNNCGVYAEGPFAEADPEAISRMFDINAKAPMLLTRYLLDQLKDGSASLIINISSIQAIAKDSSLAAYAASKSALSTFSEALRKELNPLGIRVTCIEPSGVNTWGEQNPVKLLAPEDIASVIKSIMAMGSSVQINTVVVEGL
ncbi:MAG: hypothetical protein RL518_2374 [Pseudomonadota bacterium]|jgi:3-oxoacyl-[acyl-carrier protein] reductase